MEAWAYGTLALIGGIVVIASASGAIAGTSVFFRERWRT
jgi:hypothetical protein